MSRLRGREASGGSERRKRRVDVSELPFPSPPLRLTPFFISRMSIPLPHRIALSLLLLLYALHTPFPVQPALHRSFFPLQSHLRVRTPSVGAWTRKLQVERRGRCADSATAGKKRGSKSEKGAASKRTKGSRSSLQRGAAQPSEMRLVGSTEVRDGEGRR